MDQRDIDFIAALAGLLKLSKNIVANTKKHLLGRLKIAEGIQLGIKNYEKVFRKTKGKDIDKHHRDNFAIVFDRFKVGFLTIKEDNSWLLWEKTATVRYGESKGIKPKQGRPIMLPLGHLFGLAIELKKNAEKNLKGIDPKNWDRDIAKPLNYPDAMLWYIFKALVTIMKIPIINEPKNSITEYQIVTPAETKTMKKIVKYFAKEIGVKSESRGGISSLMNMATSLMSSIDGNAPDLNEMPVPDESDVLESIGDIFSNKKFRKGMSGVMEKVQGAEDLGDVMKIMGQVLQEGAIQEAIQDTVGHTFNMGKKKLPSAKDIITEDAENPINIPSTSSSKSKSTTLAAKSKKSTTPAAKSKKSTIKSTKKRPSKMSIQILSDSDED